MDPTSEPGKSSKTPIPQTESEGTTLLEPTPSNFTNVQIRTPPRPPPLVPVGSSSVIPPAPPLPQAEAEDVESIGQPRFGYSEGRVEKWMMKVRYGPATRGDMETLADYLKSTPQSPRTGSPGYPLDDQFDATKVPTVLDYNLRALMRDEIFIWFHDNDSFFLDPHDWQTKLGDAEGTLLESVTRFILHAAIYSADASAFAFGRDTEEGRQQRMTEVDCLKDFVMDIVHLARFLRESAEAKAGDLPSLKDFVSSRIARLDNSAKLGKRRPRKAWFAPNSERSTHAYARKACCVIMGLTDDYDQRPIFGFNRWDKRILIFDNLGQLLWKGFGLKLGNDTEELKKMTGTIPDLDANVIESGPFKFSPTTRIQEHLTLDRDGKVRIYVSKALEHTAFMFQCHRIATAAHIDHLGLEIGRSYALLFLQNPHHRAPHAHRIAQSLGIRLDRVSLGGGVQPFDFLDIYYDSLKWGNMPRLEDFVLLRPRLYELQREMNDWRPQAPRELWQKGYRDPLTWYGFIFAVFVGIIGICSLAVSIVQAVKAFYP